MSDLLRPEDFRGLEEPLTVELRVEGGTTTVALSVAAVDVLPSHRFRDAPFSLSLRGPRVPLLPQATYALAHPRLGRIELFLVPVGQDRDGSTYEATFN